MRWIARFALCCAVGLAAAPGCGKDKSSDTKTRAKPDKTKTAPPTPDAAPAKRPAADAGTKDQGTTDFERPAIIDEPG